jgi:nicotinic acid mononucleotide adenylyltransferase
LTVAIYLAHLNPVTNAHVEIIEELKKDAKVKVMPVVFLDDGIEVNSRSFPFSFETRKKMLTAVFGDTIEVSSNYTFYAPFFKYFPPMLSPYSWKLRSQILKGVNEDFYTYTGDKTEGLMLKAYRLNPKVGTRKEVSATSVKNKLYDAALGKESSWKDDVPKEVVKIIEENWDVVKKYASSPDATTRIAGMKFPKAGHKTR